MTFYLFKEKVFFKTFEDHQKTTEHKLRRHGAIEQHQVCFSENKHVTGSLTSSISKLDAIKRIVDFEFKQMEHQLRLVVLTDFIRKEFYADIAQNDFELNKIGVLAIFEKLRRNNAAAIKIGVLTGTVVIIPLSAYPVFSQKAANCGLSNIKCNVVPFDAGYMLIEECEQLKNDIVRIITEIFEQGEIEVLIGTKSLLGEGWDAPAINTLILASFVGSFVLSNQMRGRAIRTQKGNLDKAANIWHLCCVDPTSTTGGIDLAMLKRRFRSFVGTSFKDESGIENGLNRLNIPENLHVAGAVQYKNDETFAQAADREALKDCWQAALENGVSLTEEIKVPFAGEREYHALKSMYFNKTIKNLLAALGFGLVDYLLGTLQALGRAARVLGTRDGLYTYLAIIGVIGILIFGRLAAKAFRLYVKYRDIAKDIKQIGDALLDTMLYTGVIKTNRAELAVDASIDKFGAVYCHLDGGTTYERSAFINMLHEIIEPIDNPRYVIIRKSLFMLFVKQRDFHSVPELIGKNKSTATYFEDKWKQYVGPCELIFTRTIDGRQMLLRSRIKALAAQFDSRPLRVSKWT